MTHQDRMPAVFIGHGSPMNALERNAYTEMWRALGESMAPPTAVLAISAHWYINATAVTAMRAPRTIHDFFGFPDELFAYQYPAPGSAQVAARVAEVADPRWVGFDQDSWGIDHGTWSVLAHMFPGSDVPVVQLSVNALQPADYHLDFGRRLDPLRDEGVLILGSGNIVHNLPLSDFGRPNEGEEWAERFDADAMSLLTTEPGAAAGLAERADFDLVAPTAEHFLPVLYIAGLAEAAGKTLDVLVAGCAFGGISMTSYGLGTPVIAPREAAPEPS